MRWMIDSEEALHDPEQVFSCICRSTGEFPSMTLDEREQVAEVARATWPGRQIVNISTCNVTDSLRLLRHAMQGRGSPKVSFYCKRRSQGALTLLVKP